MRYAVDDDCIMVDIKQYAVITCAKSKVWIEIGQPLGVAG